MTLTVNTVDLWDIFAEGGATFDRDMNPIDKTTGYMVPIETYTVRARTHDLVRYNLWYLLDVLKNELTSENTYLVIRTDEKKRFTMEVAFWYERREEAMSFGDIFRQGTVHDIERDEFICLK